MRRPRSPTYSPSTWAPCVLAWRPRSRAVSRRTFREGPLVDRGPRSVALCRLCRVGEAAIAGCSVGQVGLDRALFLAFGEELARDRCRADHRATAGLLG